MIDMINVVTYYDDPMMKATTKSGIFLDRYARQMALPEIGEGGQARLSAGRVLVIGLGGLGSPAGFYLAAAGVGRIGLVDSDRVEISNLQRQIAHVTADVGQDKVVSAAARFRALNPEVVLDVHAVRFEKENGLALVQAYDFVIDATDNFSSKFLIADLCHAAGKPYCHAGIRESLGQAITVLPGKTTCYRCLFEAPPVQELADAPRGPLGVVPGVLGVIQASEAVKFLLGVGTLLTDRLLTFDAMGMAFRTVSTRRNPGCALCGATR